MFSLALQAYRFSDLEVIGICMAIGIIITILEVFYIRDLDD
jgi:uncharacterized membrane protein